MPVEVRPDSFSMVLFDAAEIRAMLEELVTKVGLDPDQTVTLEIDETTPLGRAVVTSTDPIVIEAESGALEDPKKPRQIDVEGAPAVLGKLLLQTKDRLDPAFGAPPAETELTLQLSSAWETYAVGRLARLGYKGQRQRRLYQFRNRHGFTDVADAAFDKLWTSDDLTWADIQAASEAALQR